MLIYISAMDGPDWKVCIVQPRFRLRNFSAWARRHTKLKNIASSAQIFKNTRAKNENCVIIQAQRARFEIAQFYKRA